MLHLNFLLVVIFLRWDQKEVKTMRKEKKVIIWNLEEEWKTLT